MVSLRTTNLQIISFLMYGIIPQWVCLRTCSRTSCQHSFLISFTVSFLPLYKRNVYVPLMLHFIIAGKESWDIESTWGHYTKGQFEVLCLTSLPLARHRVCQLHIQIISKKEKISVFTSNQYTLNLQKKKIRGKLMFYSFFLLQLFHILLTFSHFEHQHFY